VNPNIATNFKFLEDQLETAPGGGPYICGPDLTGADILLSFPLIAAMGRGKLKKEQYPKVAAYAQRLREEKGYKAAVLKIVEKEGSFEEIP